MIKNLLLLVGMIIFIGGVIFYFTILRHEQLASTLDDKKTSAGFVQGPPLCNWTLETPERVMTEEKSQALLIKFINPASEQCESTLSLRSPGFDSSPAKDTQFISIPPGKEGSLSWIITPRKSGTYQLALADDLNTVIVGISVTNTFGLNAFQAKIASILGGLFGPMLTVPWWWERLRRKKIQ